MAKQKGEKNIKRLDKQHKKAKLKSWGTKIKKKKMENQKVKVLIKAELYSNNRK